ncbi:MAG: arsenic efflux protein, partial [Oscillospiraceae bacterium]|nr:arsenic efflux protein [Oscillospiraceae bacterium]
MSCNFLNTIVAHSHGSLGGSFDIWDVLLDALIDSAKMLPFLFLAFLLMEFIEHRAGDKLVSFLQKNGGGRVGSSAVGAVVGCVPQCGFSVAASNLYAGGVISVGTLIAVFISTSDEAIPVLLAHPEHVGAIWRLIAVKIIIAAAAGIIADVVVKIFKLERDGEAIEDICSESGCGCGSHGIWYSSFRHTVNIFIFILIVNLVFGMIMAFAGEDTVKGFLEGMGVFQPILSGIVGMIPNCAASVLITELYADGAISFGSAAAGLCTGAGVGLAVLFRANKNIRENLTIMVIVYAVGVLSGMI